MSRVNIPSALRAFTGNQSEVVIVGDTVGKVIEALLQSFPRLRPHLLQETGEIRRFVNVYVNAEDVRFLDQMETPVAEDDEIHIVPSVAGGAVSRR